MAPALIGSGWTLHCCNQGQEGKKDVATDRQRLFDIPADPPERIDLETEDLDVCFCWPSSLGSSSSDSIVALIPSDRPFNEINQNQWIFPETCIVSSLGGLAWVGLIQCH